MTVMKRGLVLLGTLGVGAVLTLARAQTPETVSPPPANPAPADGAEAQARGPVHEAFAAPVGGAPQATAFVPKQPPAAIDEMPAEQKPAGDNVQWIPGYWSWDGDRKDYMWVSGFWRTPPPGRTWVPGHWNEVSQQWQWVPGFWQGQQQQEVAYLPAPPAPVQAAPSVPAPNAEAVFVPGSWVWRDGRYLWRPGYWVNYRPGWVWVPASYTWTPAGYVFVEGYWDYPLRERGLLFAPVYIDVAFYSRPRYVYRPAFVITDDHLYGAMFVSPGYGYYYGDYFAVEYRRAGFVAWCDYHAAYGPDPIFAYYRWSYRSDPTWSIELRACYTGRYNGTIAPPPRTVVNNVTVIKNTTVINNTTNVTNVTNNTTTVTNNRFAAAGPAARPLSEMARTSPVKLQPVSAAQQQAHLQAARQMQTLSAQRGQQERQLRAQLPAGATAPRTAQTAKLNIPKAAPTASGASQAPPHPAAASATHPSTPGSGATSPGGHGAPAGGTQPSATTPGAHPTTGSQPSATTPGAHPTTGSQPSATTPGAGTPGAHPGTTGPGGVQPGAPGARRPPPKPQPHGKDHEKGHN